MRIETLLQDPKVREAMELVLSDQGLLLDEMQEEAKRGTTNGSRHQWTREETLGRLARAFLRLPASLCAALAGAGEELEEAAEWLWNRSRQHGDPAWSSLPPHARRIWLDAAGELAPLLRAPLLVRVATLEAEKDFLKGAVDAAIADAEHYRAERDEMREALAAYGIGKEDNDWHYTCEPHGEVDVPSLKEAIGELIMLEDTDLSTVEAERNRLLGVVRGVESIRDELGGRADNADNRWCFDHRHPPRGDRTMSDREPIDLADLVYLATDHGLDPKRPYNGQPHTDQGERGKTLVSGLTFRDVMDCFVIAWLQAAGRSSLAESGTASYNDLYLEPEHVDGGTLDPLAVAQNMTCEMEKRMGIYPNVPGLRSKEAP